MNIFTVQKIRTVHVQMSPFRLKYTPSTCLCAVDVRNNQFVVPHFLPIHMKDSPLYGLNN
jgi:hypothetical protein